MAESITVDNLLNNIYVYRVYDYVEQLACVKALPTFLETHPQVRHTLLQHELSVYIEFYC